MRIIFAPNAEAQLEKLEPAVRKRIRKKLDFYASQPDPLSFAERLTGYNAYRFRIGKDYRVIFEVGSDTLYVLLVVKREGAYQDL